MCTHALDIMLRILVVAAAFVEGAADVTDATLVRRQQKGASHVQLLPDGSSENIVSLVDRSISSDEAKAARQFTAQQWSQCYNRDKVKTVHFDSKPDKDIVILILASRFDVINASMQTWLPLFGNRAEVVLMVDELLYHSKGDLSAFPVTINRYMTNSGKDGYWRASETVVFAFQDYVSRAISGTFDADWLVMIDDDTFLDPLALRDLLSQYDRTKPTIMGSLWGCCAPLCGGLGIFLNRAALLQFGQDCLNYCQPDNYFWDMALGAQIGAENFVNIVNHSCDPGPGGSPCFKDGLVADHGGFRDVASMIGRFKMSGLPGKTVPNPWRPSEFTVNEVKDFCGIKKDLLVRASPAVKSLLDYSSTEKMKIKMEELKLLAGFMGGGLDDVLQSLAVPGAALLIAFFMHVRGQRGIVAKAILFFGLNTAMNIYMKTVLSQAVVSESPLLRGLPAPFAVTAIQQMVCFTMAFSWIGISKLTPWPYSPPVLTSRAHLLSILCLSAFFTCNIGLNNWSLSLLDISTNLMIRSTSQVITCLLDMAVMLHTSGTYDPKQCFKEIALTVLGCIFSIVVVSCKTTVLASPMSQQHFYTGVIVCTCSVAFASMELVLVRALKDHIKLSPIDMVLYVPVPATILLSIPMFLLKRSVPWPDHGLMTDVQVLSEVYAMNKFVLFLGVMSGVFAMLYNVTLYTLVVDISASFSSLASNFNKVAIIALSICLGMERLPRGMVGVEMVASILGNGICFAAYGLIRQPPNPKAITEQPKHVSEPRPVKQSPES